MIIYTRCDQCDVELEIINFSTKEVVDGISTDKYTLCNKCNYKRQSILLNSICKTYNIEFEKSQTFVKNNILYLSKKIDIIDRDEYGINEYYFIVDTETLKPGIFYNDNIFDLSSVDKDTIDKIIELIKFICN